ncbi:MAG TPA: choice-of-anchor D domain-containing protein, partial [Polyangiaceae bacterium]|nr:choice-of-anchor D domain-containing protein [Polyangiaceae bacterium]
MKRGAADTGRNSLAVRGWLAIAAAVVFTGALTACGGDDTGGNANPGDGGGDATEAAAEGGGDAPIDVKGDVKGDAPSDALSDVADVVGDSSPDVLSDASEAGDVKTDAPAPSDAGDAGDVKTDAPGDAMPDADATSVGDGGDAGDATLAPLASIPTATINLGSGNCGGTAVSTMLTITNSGTAALTVNASISGTVFSVTPSTLSVAANMTGKLTITATVPSGSTAGSALTGSLALTTNDTTHPTASIPLSVTAQGVTLAWDTGSPTKADFGVVPNNVAATAISLMLKNTGNASASVTLGTPSNGQFSLAPATATIAAGATATLTAGFTPTSLSQSLATSTITATGAICGTSVSSLAFSGQGAVGSVTGWPSAALDFGGNACGGAAAASQSFVLTNSGGLAAHITGATYAGYAGYSDDGNGKTIQPGGTLTVHITPPAIPTTSAVPGNYDATVTFATDVAGDSPHQVSLTEHALGAILAFDTTATANFGAFGNVPVGSVANQSFNIVNSGNAPATNVALTTTTPFSVATANVVSLAASATQPDTATFTPSTFGAATAQLSIAAGNLCQPAPQAIALAGIGQSGGIALSTQGFGLATNCGTTGIRSTLTITNSG